MCKHTARRLWGIGYFIVGFIMIWASNNAIPNLKDLTEMYSPIMFWCIAWALSGIGVFLISSHKDERRKNSYVYIFRFGFYSFLSALAAFVVFLKLELTLSVAYFCSALTALVLGLTGNRLLEKFINYLSKNKPSDKNL